MVVADENANGKLDLVAANKCSSTLGCSPATTGGVGVLLGNGDGTFKPAITYSSGGFDAASVAIGDLNQDGKLDIVVANQCATEPFCQNDANGSVGVLLGNGDGTFKQGVVVTTPGQNNGPLALADFNGDKKLDVASGAGNVLLLGKGDGTFGSPLALGAFGPGIAKGDLNHDGKQDLVVRGATVLLNVSSSK